MEESETIKHEKTFSVEMVRNSKGYTYAVKVSSDDDLFVKSKVAELLSYCESVIAQKKVLEG